jgi:hypothetical protein
MRAIQKVGALLLQCWLPRLNTGQISVSFITAKSLATPASRLYAVMRIPSYYGGMKLDKLNTLLTRRVMFYSKE